MGKKNRNNKKRVLGECDISMLTPLQERRFHMVKLNVDTIARQTWVSRIKEWVVVDGTPGSPSPKWGEVLEEARAYAASFPQLKHVKIVDAGESHPPKNRVIGCFRNCINDTMTGEWGVWMDDDDVYPNTRVEVAVSMMEREKKVIAGCSPHLITDPDLGDMTFMFRVFHPNHATNNTMAYHRSVLKESRYNDDAKNAEEPMFLRQFKIPMAQIPSEHAVLQMAHKQNTYNKRELLTLALTAKYFDQGNESRMSCRLVGTKPGSFVRVPERVINQYRHALFDDLLAQSPYEIVYYLGIHKNRPTWSPYQDNLGGSEQAVLHLAEYWASKGYRVAVYGHLHGSDPEKPLLTPDDSFIHNNVAYHASMTFRCSHRYKNLIIWRQFGGVPLMYVRLHVDNLLLDLHDRHDYRSLEVAFGESKNKFDVVSVKSDFHKSQVLETLRHFNSSYLLKTWEPIMFVQPNGVRREVFFDETRSYAPRSPYKLLYCSSYDRGLEQILQWFFPTLRQMDPRFTLEVMYGMDAMNPQQQEVLRRLLKQPGVTDHGRVSKERVRDFKYECGFHLYYTWTTAEIDCISVRESALCGCIPLLSFVGVFRERCGFHFEGDPLKFEDHVKAAGVFHGFLKQNPPEKIEEIRKQCVESRRGFDWEEAGREWLKRALKVRDLDDEQDEDDVDFDYDRDVASKRGEDEKKQQIVLSV